VRGDVAKGEEWRQRGVIGQGGTRQHDGGDMEGSGDTCQEVRGEM
jgi:hypothetical protein